MALDEHLFELLPQDLRDELTHIAARGGSFRLRRLAPEDSGGFTAVVQLGGVGVIGQAEGIADAVRGALARLPEPSGN